MDRIPKQTMNPIAILNRVLSALVPAALLILLPGCSTSNPPKDQMSSSVSFQQGVPGGVMTQTYKTIATVTAIDAATRQVTLLASDGSKQTITAGPDVVNFNQIQVGDQIKVTVAKELVAYMAHGATPTGDGAAAAVALAPVGAKPGGVAADTVQVTAQITAIDLASHQATLQLPDGSSATFPVRPDVDLTQRHVGESVVIRTTRAVAILVEKP
jgi:translation elongation factor P/translation initiation factor 5A